MFNITVQQIGKWAGKTGEQEVKNSAGEAELFRVGRERGSCAEFWKDLTRLSDYAMEFDVGKYEVMHMGENQS